MNFMSYVNEITQSNYGFGCVLASSPVVRANHDDLVVIQTVNQFLPGSSDPEGIASKLNEIMENHQQVRIRGTFFEAKAIQVIGDMNQPRVHAIQILGQAALFSASDESDEFQLEELTQGYQSMSVLDQEMVMDG